MENLNKMYLFVKTDYINRDLEYVLNIPHVQHE